MSERKLDPTEQEENSPRENAAKESPASAKELPGEREPRERGDKGSDRGSGTGSRRPRRERREDEPKEGVASRSGEDMETGPSGKPRRRREREGERDKTSGGGGGGGWMSSDNTASVMSPARNAKSMSDDEDNKAAR